MSAIIKKIDNENHIQREEEKEEEGPARSAKRPNNIDVETEKLSINQH